MARRQPVPVASDLVAELRAHRRRAPEAVVFRDDQRAAAEPQQLRPGPAGLPETRRSSHVGHADERFSMRD
ncbi:MAG TPA: hypothetical protein VE088_02815 [Gaiellaceae bacterium]|nr:hypothetical protein [Gaiellaceae bacterium]